MSRVVSETNTIALAALGGVVVAWLCVSFLRPSRGRATVEWLGTIAGYVALNSFFLGQLLSAWSQARIPLVIAFGLLELVFGIGLLVAIGKVASHLRNRSAAGSNVTN